MWLPGQHLHLETQRQLQVSTSHTEPEVTLNQLLLQPPLLRTWQPHLSC